jgi:hypothetical protein
MKNLDTNQLITNLNATLATLPGTTPTSLNATSTTQGCITTTTAHFTPDLLDPDNFDNWDQNFLALQDSITNTLQDLGYHCSILQLGVLDQVLITAQDEPDGDTYAHILLTFWDGEYALTITAFAL